MSDDGNFDNAEHAGYRSLTAETVGSYLWSRGSVTSRLGGSLPDWTAREMGDGNLNLVFAVAGPGGKLIVKQALPYVRMVGDSWPLPLARAHFEHRALLAQARCASAYVPAVFDADAKMALTIMEHLEPHRVLRKGLLDGTRYPDVGRDLGLFLASTLYHTSSLHLDAAPKKAMMNDFVGNTAMCKISEDLIFDEPYFAAAMNFHTTPQLDAFAAELRRDTRLKLAVQELKWCFLNSTEALLHGDLHTGSVMATAFETRVIDPEFAFFGPMGFDIGMLLGNFLMASLAQSGRGRVAGERREYAGHVLEQIGGLWRAFAREFAALWRAGAARGTGCAYHARLYPDAPSLLEAAIRTRLAAIWRQAVGFAGCEMIRRIVGLSHVEDFEGIGDADRRAWCEAGALRLARELVTDAGAYPEVDDLIAAVPRIATDDSAARCP